MLRKRLKYDFKAQFRLLWPLYAALIVLSVGIRVYDWLQTTLQWSFFYWPIVDFFVNLYAMIFVVLLIGLFIWTMIVCVRDFYTSMLKDEGYLTHTLPVSENTLFLSKEIVSVLAYISSIIVFALSLLIVLHGTYMAGIFHLLQYVFFRADVSFILFLVLLFGIVSCYASITLYYLSMMLGQLHRSSKGLFAVAYFFLISFGMQLIVFVGLMLFGTVANMIDPSIYYEIDVFINDHSTLAPILLFIGMIIYNLIVGIIMHTIGVWIAEHKLNLE